MWERHLAAISVPPKHHFRGKLPLPQFKGPDYQLIPAIMQENMVRFSLTIELNNTRRKVIEEQLNFEGVNGELGPFVRMTAPDEWKTESLTRAPADKRLFSSIILLYGIIPVDFHHIQFKEIGNNGFVEESVSLWMERWQHRRDITDTDDGCMLTDEIVFASRIPGMDRLLAPIYRFVFRHRHARLAAKYNR